MNEVIANRPFHVLPYMNCLVAPDERFFFVLIPKNAHSWAKWVLHETLNWKTMSYKNVPKTAIPLFVLRDPIDKWKSGIAQYIVWRFGDLPENEFVDLMNDRFFWDLVFTQFNFDGHTEHQYAYLLTDEIGKKAIFFKFGENLSSDFHNFLNKEGYEIASADINKIINPGGYHHFRHLVEQRVEELLQDHDYFAKLQFAHELDYRLLSQVKYYGN